MHKIADIQRFIANKTGADISKVSADCDIERDLGCTGDDFHGLMQDYSSVFQVDMSSYLWYFHTGEEGQNFGAAFFKSPPSRVDHIAVTPQLLVDVANKGHWDISYPPHKMPKRRYDILVNQLLVGVFICLILYRCTR
ncbi:DUF1493 family protein [Fibrella arboris]|uniref:DUF1493 family protein n=1 Tax=Fibrella arboris TaxID=3242486 RepID=UPI003521A3C1